MINMQVECSGSPNSRPPSRNHLLSGPTLQALLIFKPTDKKKKTTLFFLGLLEWSYKASAFKTSQWSPNRNAPQKYEIRMKVEEESHECHISIPQWMEYCTKFPFLFNIIILSLLPKSFFFLTSVYLFI